jgi:hypothetical protein
VASPKTFSFLAKQARVRLGVGGRIADPCPCENLIFEVALSVWAPGLGLRNPILAHQFVSSTLACRPVLKGKESRARYTHKLSRADF